MADLNPEAFQQRVLERLTDIGEELHATREETFAIGRRLDSMDETLKILRTDLTNITRTHGAVMSMLSAFDDRQIRNDGQLEDLLRRVERIERQKGDAA